MRWGCLEDEQLLKESGTRSHGKVLRADIRMETSDSTNESISDVLHELISSARWQARHTHTPPLVDPLWAGNPGAGITKSPSRPIGTRVFTA